MDIRYARELLVLAGCCNYAEAAEKLYVSQSTLFKHVKSVESEFGIRAFDKKGNRIELSGEGEILVKYLQQHLELDEAMARELDRYHNKDSQIVLMAIQYRAIEFVYAFRKLYSNYLVQYIGSDFSEDNALDLLRDGKSELAFLLEPAGAGAAGVGAAGAGVGTAGAGVGTADRAGAGVGTVGTIGVNRIGTDRAGVPIVPMEYPDIERILVTEDEACVCLYASHPLADRPVLRFEDIRREAFILRGSGPVHREEKDANGVDQVRRLFARCGGEPTVAAVSSRSTDILEYVRHELGISILLQKSVSDADSQNIVFRPLDPPEPFRLYLCRRKGETLSSGASAFVGFMKAAVRARRIDEILAGKA